MKTNAESLIDTTVLALYLAEQIDLIHLSIATLSDSVDAGETDLFLERPGKSVQQKKLYLDKLVGEVRSPELKAALKRPLQEADTEFFLRTNLTSFLTDLERRVEQVQILRLTVAIEFKPADVRVLVASLSKRLGRPVAFDMSVDSTLIGGAIIQHGNYITDYSIKSRLTRFRQEWKAAALEKAR